MLLITSPAMTALAVLLACLTVFVILCTVAVIVLCYKVGSLEEELRELRGGPKARQDTLPVMLRPSIRIEPVLSEAEPPAVRHDVGRGEMSVFDVPDRTAAKLMAIVAEETGLPLSELVFLSIREVK